MNTKWTVIMSSRKYGREAFEYDSEADADAGIERLKAQAKKLKDRVKRKYRKLPPVQIV